MYREQDLETLKQRINELQKENQDLKNKKLTRQLTRRTFWGRLAASVWGVVLIMLGGATTLAFYQPDNWEVPAISAYIFGAIALVAALPITLQWIDR